MAWSNVGFMGKLHGMNGPSTVEPKNNAFLKTYGRSMKPEGMDGPIDLLIYRPIGFAIAWCLSFTRVSPNAVTLVSALLGIAAGVCAMPGTASAFLICALLYQAYNCFDCADGQLARLTGRYSKEGRIFDGAADYTVNVCLCLGSLVGLVRSGQNRLVALAVVAAGGLAMAFSCLIFDKVIMRYAKFVEGGGDDDAAEIREARESAASAKGILRVLWRIYAFYLGIQSGKMARIPAVADSSASRKAYADYLKPLIKAWSFAGPSAYVLYFLIFAAVGKVLLFFYASIIIAIASLLFLGTQQLFDMRFAAKYLVKD